MSTLALFIVRPRSIPLVLWATILVTAPIASILPGPGEARLLVLPWLLITVIVVFGLDILSRESARHRLAALIVVTTIAAVLMVQNRDAWARHLAASDQLSAEGRFLVHHATERDALRHASMLPLDVESLNWIRTTRYHGSPAAAFVDDVYLCTSPAKPRRVWEYRESSRRVEEVTSAVASLTSDFCRALRYDVPLTVEASYSGVVPRFSWRFGPHTNGRYFVVIGDGIQKFELPRTGSLRLLLSRDLRFRVRFDDQEGWSTYSPLLTVSFTQADSSLLWNRSSHGD
jgi:hypothetical protein